MKKTLCALLALLLALSVAACGKKVPTPSETVSAALDALKSGDMTAASPALKTPPTPTQTSSSSSSRTSPTPSSLRPRTAPPPR